MNEISLGRATSNAITVPNSKGDAVNSDHRKKRKLGFVPDAKPTPPEVTAARLRERCLIATVLDCPGKEWTPKLRRAFDLVELFQDTACRTVAEAIKAASVNKTIPTEPAIAEHLNGENTRLIFSFSSDRAVTLGIAEIEAETFLENAVPLGIETVLGESWQAIKDNPKSASSIARHTVAALERITAEGDGKSSLTLRSPDELLAMTFDDSDRIIGDRLLATGQSLAICGAGGIGKSRLLLQMAVACLGGLPFVSFETRGQEKKWLIIQAENSNRRLKEDLAALRLWIGPEHWQQVNAGLLVHTLESDVDGFLSLDNPEAQTRIAAAIASFKPDVVCFDSLYNFAAGDLNSDRDMADTLLTISRLTKTGNPSRACVLLHHSLTGKHGAARSLGYERASFGRNSKVLHSWTRAMVNIAPGSPDSNDALVITCGKMSNGKEFSPFAVRLCDSMIYAVDETFDLAGWQSDVTGKSTAAPMTPQRVKELCRAGMTKGTLAKAVMDDCGCSRATAYRHVDRATGRTIHFNKSNDTFTQK
jgi:hypothetical protein